jgi:hypothetical protein
MKKFVLNCDYCPNSENCRSKEQCDVINISETKSPVRYVMIDEYMQFHVDTFWDFRPNSDERVTACYDIVEDELPKMVYDRVIELLNQ